MINWSRMIIYDRWSLSPSEEEEMVNDPRAQERGRGQLLPQWATDALRDQRPEPSSDGIYQLIKKPKRSRS